MLCSGKGQNLHLNMLETKQGLSGDSCWSLLGLIHLTLHDSVIVIIVTNDSFCLVTALIPAVFLIRGREQNP